MTLRQQLRTGILISLIIFVLLGAAIFQTSQEIDTLSAKNEIVGATVKAAFEINSATIEYIITPSQVIARKWDARYSQLFILINAIELDAPEARQVLGKIRDNHRNLRDHFNALVTVENAFLNNDLTNETYLEMRGKEVNQLSLTLQAIVSDSTQLSLWNNEALLAAQQKLFSLAVISLLSLMAFFFAVVIYTDLRIIRSIGRLTQATRAVAQGDLSVRTPESATTKDELGELAQAFNQMTDKLQASLTGLEAELQERKRISAELQRSDDRMRALLEAVPDAKFILNKEGRFVEFIPSADFAPMIPLNEFLGKLASEVLPPNVTEMLGFYLNETRQLRQTQMFEYKLPDFDDDRFFEARLVPYGEDQVLAVVRDITTRKQALNQIEQLNSLLEANVTRRTAELQETVKELEAFSYTISHDLRAPLRAIAGYSRLITLEHADILTGESKAMLTKVYNSAVHMGTMVDDLLAFSRLGRQALQKHAIRDEQLCNLIESIISDLRAEAPERNVTVDVQNLPGCRGDLGLLKQVYVNLLSNAFKFTGNREQAVIAVGFAETPRGGAYFVRDNGAGFDMQYAGQLFGVFHRLHHQDEFEGTGVGLAIVHRIISKHGGQVWAESVLGEGTTFYFTLPK